MRWPTCVGQQISLSRVLVVDVIVPADAARTVRSLPRKFALWEIRVRSFRAASKPRIAGLANNIGAPLHRGRHESRQPVGKNAARPGMCAIAVEPFNRNAGTGLR